MFHKLRKNYSLKEKVAILRKLLLDHVTVADLCDQYPLKPMDRLSCGAHVLSHSRLLSADAAPGEDDPGTAEGTDREVRGAHRSARQFLKAARARATSLWPFFRAVWLQGR